MLLLEAGPADTYPWIHVPIGYAKTMFNPRGELVLLHRAGAWNERPQGLLAARQDPRRIELDQRPDRDPRPTRGLRPVGGRRQSRLELRRTCCPTSSARSMPIGGDQAYHGTDGPLWCSPIRRRHELIDAVIAGGGELGLAAQRRLQRRDPGRRRLLPPDHPSTDDGAVRRPRTCDRHARDPNLTVATVPGRSRSRSTAGARCGVVYRHGGSGEHRQRPPRGPALRRRPAVATAAAALRQSAPGRCCAPSAFRSCTSCRASARTCRTTCRRA